MTAVYHPAPLNQFYRLDYDEVRKVWVKTTRWNNIDPRRPGHIFDSENCMATAGAMAIDAHTGGAIRTSPAGIRNYQDDLSGGIGVDDVDTAWHRHFSEDLLTPADYSWDDVMYAIRVQRRHAIIGVDYSKVPYDYQIQKGGTFDHAINLDDFRGTDSRIRRYDPLAVSALWTPQSAYRAAAEALAIRVRGTRSSLFVGLTRSRPLLATAVLYRVQIVAAIPLYDKPYGTVAGHVTTATYTCTRHLVSGQWWYQILPTSKTANRGLWISPSRRTKVSYA